MTLSVWLLLACSSPAPEPPQPSGPPLQLSTALPTAAHAYRLEAWELLVPTGDLSVVPHAQRSTYCDWVAGRKTGPELAARFLEEGWLQYGIIELDGGGMRLAGAALASLEDGRFSTTGWALKPLHEALQAIDEVRTRCRTPDTRARPLVLAVHPGAPWDQVTQVHAATLLEDHGEPYALVDGPAHAAWTDVRPDASRTDLRVGTRLDDEDVRRLGRTTAPAPDANGIVPRDERLVGCATVVVEPQESWQQAVGALDQLAEAGVTRVWVEGSSGREDRPRPPVPASTAEHARSIGFSDPVAVLPLRSAPMLEQAERACDGKEQVRIYFNDRPRPPRPAEGAPRSELLERMRQQGAGAP